MEVVAVTVSCYETDVVSPIVQCNVLEANDFCYGFTLRLTQNRSFWRRWLVLKSEASGKVSYL